MSVLSLSRQAPAKCPGCGSLEFQNCSKGLVCSYCRIITRPAEVRDFYAPYIGVETPSAPKIGLTVEQAAANFRRLAKAVI